MDLLNKVKPTHFDDILFYEEQLKSCIQWLDNFKTKKDRTKKVLLLIGPTGCGKTCIAQLLFQKFDYKIIEQNATHLRSQKKIGEFLKKTLGFKNVIDLFYNEQKPVGLIMDEIECLIKNNDKGGLSEFIQIIKDNDKYEKNILKKKKIKININSFIAVENPIICTTNENNDKKINELKKFSHVIYFNKIKLKEYEQFVEHFKKNKNTHLLPKIKKALIKDLHQHCESDIRKFIYALENIYLKIKTNKSDKINIYEDLIHLNDTSKNDIQLQEAVLLFLKQKLNLDKMDLLFYLDPYHLPYTLYQNMIPFLENSQYKNEIKLDIYEKYIDDLSTFDKVNNLIYDNSEWLDINNLLKYYGLYNPNFNIHQYEYKHKQDFEMSYSNIHNKASQMLVNKKLLIQAKYSLNKKYANDSVLDYEIIYFFFHEFREAILEENFNDLNKKNLIVFMNKYRIKYSDLENILKIEKINKDEEKRKKNITVLLKEKIIEHLDPLLHE